MRRAVTSSTTRSSWTRRTGVAAVTGAALLVACNGGDNGAAEPDTTAATTATAPATDELPAASTAGAGDETNETGEKGETAATTAPDEPRSLSGDDDLLFDQEQLHTFEIDLPEEALAQLDADPAAEEYVEGSLTFDGETIEPIGIRYKGSVGAFIGCTAGSNPFEASGAKSCTKLSMKLKINWDDPDREFYGVRRVQLHSLNLDSSLMHERLGYWLFREMGVPAPRSTHARVVVNGEYLGVFGLTEEIDGRFTREAFDDGSGNVYKEVWPFDAAGVPRSAEEFIAGLETNEDEDPTADIITAFAADLAAAAPDERVDVLERWTDLDTLLATAVVDRAIRNDDGPIHWYCFDECAPHNFYWYEDPSTLKMSLIPWDLDNAFDALAEGTTVGNFIAVADPFGEITNDCEPFTYGSFSLLQRSAACDPLLGALATLRDDYERIRAELLAGPFAEDRIEEQLASWTEQIRPAVADAAELHDDAPTLEAWDAALDRLRDAVDISRNGDGR